MAKSKNSILTAERARELLRYDPESGKLYWRVNPGKRIRSGSEAGSAQGAIGHRYRLHVKIDGRKYFAHRLAWLIVTGAWPADQLDHIDGNGLNNRWSNLREVSNSGNQRNAKRRNDNKSGVTGVFWQAKRRKWRAQIKVNGITLHLGRFETLPAAVEARKAAECRYGFHENHGRAGVKTQGAVA